MATLNATIFDITQNAGRLPILSLDGDIECLFDTGAWITVVNRKYADTLSGHYQVSEAPLSGFGGEGVMTPIHLWCEFELKQNSSVICFKNTLTFVSDFDKHQIILSPFFLHNHNIGISRFLKFLVDGETVVDCQCTDNTLESHYEDNNEVMSILTQL